MFSWRKLTELPVIIAHRGSSELAPENTLTAFQKALKEGADAIELDVRLTRDKEIVVIHDSKLNRTTDGYGNVEDAYLADIKKLDAGSWFNSKFSSERVPTLEEVFKLVRKKAGINIEIKPKLRYPNIMVQKCVGLVQKYSLQNSVLISSFDHSIVKKVKLLDERISTGILYSPMIHFGKNVVKLAKSNYADFVIMSKNYLKEELVKKVHQEKLYFFVYNINNRLHLKTMLNLKVDGIITNSPKSINNYLLNM
ncbi:MAG: Glycerophosphoryl diester phosphodiesterase [Ignavibacteriae bacterium]|nr:MAG: Glycerophosphoryl diester phosphodiesterase [Ignavibacteriota bacterium]